MVRDGHAGIAVDSRTTCVRPAPANKWGYAERAQILAVANSEEFASLPLARSRQRWQMRVRSVGIELLPRTESGVAALSPGRCEEAVQSCSDQPLRHWPVLAWSWDITWVPMR